MESWAARPKLERSDRDVRRAQFRLAGGVSQHRAVFSTEEALRLTTLPGENEGRAYFFRHLNVSRLPANCERSVWTGRFHSAMAEMAAAARHGSDPQAEAAESVFFASHEEAGELLLTRLLARQPAREWFWSMVLGNAAPADRESRLAVLIDRICQTPAGWVAVAASVFTALKEREPVELLAAIPAVLARQWLGEWGSVEVAPAERAHVLPAAIRAQVARVASWFGADDPRSLWFTGLAVIHVSPAELATGRVVRRAQSVLRAIVAPDPPQDLKSSTDPGSSVESPRPMPELPPAVARPATLQFTEESSSESATPTQKGIAPARGQSQPDALQRDAAAGDKTAAAGFYFLLNALAQLGIAEAIAHAPDAFLHQLLGALATHARVAAEDPVREWLDATAPPPGPAAITFSSTLWPRNVRLPAERTREIAATDLVRIWCVAVRRWCWRVGRIRITDVVTRPGRVRMSRTHLDITLPLHDVDLRIRRVGLDIDPGWVPWFGRVVYFHYEERRR